MLVLSSRAFPQLIVQTIAGSTPGYADGTGAGARFQYPRRIKSALTGGTFYIADQDNHRIRMMDSLGTVTTVAGSGVQGTMDGPALQAQFNRPTGLAVDNAGNIIIADCYNDRIRKLIRATGMVVTVAGSVQGYLDGNAAKALFNSPRDVCVDDAGTIYVNDSENNKIRKITPAGNVSTIAGGAPGYTDGIGPAARFNLPDGICLDSAGNLYVADFRNHAIRRIDPAGRVTTIAGTGIPGSVDGPASIARFFGPTGVSLDRAGDIIVCEWDNNLVRRISSAGIVSRVAGSGASGFQDGPALAARFNNPGGLTVGTDGRIYVAEHSNHLIRIILPATTGPCFSRADVIGEPEYRFWYIEFETGSAGDPTVSFHVRSADDASFVSAEPVSGWLQNSSTPFPAREVGWNLPGLIPIPKGRYGNFVVGFNREDAKVPHQLLLDWKDLTGNVLCSDTVMVDGRCSRLTSERPSITMLRQNYPNPANPCAIIAYSVDRRAPVLLTLHGISGERRMTIVDAVMDKGYHTALLDASALPSGNYYYLLRVGDEQYIRKCSITK